MKTASQKYLEHCEKIMALGSMEEARGLRFRELMGVTYTVPMDNPVIRIPSRNLGYRFAVAEPHWILSGSNLLSGIAKFGKMAPYSDDGYFMSGAYGPKIIDQLCYVCETLANDPGSRQAVINIWRERPGSSRDIPCTLSLQFLIRDGRINCMATMRSSDAWMGLPYDSILFSLCSAYILSIMKHHYIAHNYKLGDLSLFLGSAHIYDRNFEDVEKMLTGWDFETRDPVSFNCLSLLAPDKFLERLEAAAMDEDGSGVLQLSEFTL